VAGIRSSSKRKQEQDFSSMIFRRFLSHPQTFSLIFMHTHSGEFVLN